MLPAFHPTQRRKDFTWREVYYEPTPGRLIFFPSYMPHQYVVDLGYEPFRFIHWNCQAIPKSVLNVKN